MAISEQCFRAVDVWSDIIIDFGTIRGMIIAGKEYKDMENVFGDLGRPRSG